MEKILYFDSRSQNVFPHLGYGSGGGEGCGGGRGLSEVGTSGVGGVLDVTNLLLRAERCVCVLVRMDNPFPTL